MQAGLYDQQRPFGVTLADGMQYLKHRSLVDISHFHHSNQ